MKRMNYFVLLFTLCATWLISASDFSVLSQKYLLSNLKDYFSANAVVYEKYKEIYARKAQAGEAITTITSDGLETINTAQEGDMIVVNNTRAKEQYIVPGSKFNARYMLVKQIDNVWSKYMPKGEIRAVKVDKKLLAVLNKDNILGLKDGDNLGKIEFYIMAAWNEKMTVKAGDYLVSPLDYSEIYRIADKEFKETYRKKKK